MNRLSRVCWEDLPQEMCEEIGKRIKSRLSILHFRSVCKKWRSSLPFPNRLPLRVPPPPNCSRSNKYRPFKITQADFYDTNNSELPRVVLEEIDRHGNFFPYWSFGSEVTNSLRPQHYTASHTYHLRIFPSNSRNVPEAVIHLVKNVVIVVSDEANGVNPNYVRDSDLTVVAHLYTGKKRGRLAMFRLQGETYERWVWDTRFCRRVFEAICSFRGRLCMLDSKGRVFIMSNDFLEMKQLTPPSSIGRGKQEKHLFEASGDLCLVKLPKIEIFKYSFQLQQWIGVISDANICRFMAHIMREWFGNTYRH